MPKISFVMPTKNREDLIAESIKSVIEQTYHDWELVIVDDHSDSKDQTEKVVKKFHDNRINFLRLPDKLGRGVSCARNYGNLNARGEIIAVQDSDDLSIANRAELIADSYSKSEWDVFYGKYLVLDGNGETRDPNKQAKQFNLSEYIKGSIFIPHCSSAYTKKIATQYSYDLALSIGEDYDFFLRIALDKKRFYFCQEYVYKYRIHKDSLTKGKGFSDVEETILANKGLSR